MFVGRGERTEGLVLDDVVLEEQVLDEQVQEEQVLEEIILEEIILEEIILEEIILEERFRKNRVLSDFLLLLIYCTTSSKTFMCLRSLRTLRPFPNLHAKFLLIHCFHFIDLDLIIRKLLLTQSLF
jgi:hypothetical protein